MRRRSPSRSRRRPPDYERIGVEVVQMALILVTGWVVLTLVGGLLAVSLHDFGVIGNPYGGPWTLDLLKATVYGLILLAIVSAVSWVVVVLVERALVWVGYVSYHVGSFIQSRLGPWYDHFRGGQ